MYGSCFDGLKDAERAHGGKKPGGKMGFEALLETLDKAVLSSTPDAASIMKQTASLTSAMVKYATELPPEESDFADDIKDFVRVLHEIARACEINAKQVDAQNKAWLVARNKPARINQIGDALQTRLNNLRMQLLAVQGDARARKALPAEVTEQDNAIQELGEQMGELTEAVIKLTND